MLFIVKGKIEAHHYMQDEPEVESVIHPVEADDEDDARRVFEDHFRAMDRPYDISYFVREVSVFETLTKAKNASS